MTVYRQTLKQDTVNSMPKRIVPLSDIQVKNYKPKESDYKIADGGGGIC